MNTDSHIYHFCKRIERSGTHRRKLKKINENTFIVGTSMKVKNFPNYVIDICSTNEFEIDKKKCHFFQRVLKNSIYYETEFYARNKRTNSSCIQFLFDNVIHVGIIKTFFRVCQCSCDLQCQKCNIDCKNYAIVSTCNTNKSFHCDFVDDYIPTIYSCEETNNLQIINVSDILNICYYICVSEKIFVIELTNNNEWEN